MFLIPDIFEDHNEDYVTVESLQNFCKENNMKKSLTKQELFRQISDFSQLSQNNFELVLNWFDGLIKEGTKEVYAYKYKFLNSSCDILDLHIKKLDKKLESDIRHFLGNTYNNNFKFIKYEINEDLFGNKYISMFFCKKLYCYDSSKHYAKLINYPVIVDIYLEYNIMCCRAKPRSVLYEYMGLEFNYDTHNTTDIKAQINEIIKLTEGILCLSTIVSEEFTWEFKNKIFNLLHKYTKTPKEIKEIMSKNKTEIIKVKNSIINLCNLKSTLSKDVESDVKNIIEKYLSISWPNEDIFIKDREAYPSVLLAMDEEKSKMQQTSNSNTPLQKKSIFFDNKKMLYKNETCEGVMFHWKKKKDNSKSFKVRISIDNKRGACIFKFIEYTNEEDIQNVLLSIIGVKPNN